MKTIGKLLTLAMLLVSAAAVATPLNGRPDIPMQPSASWSAATGSDPNATQGLWTDGSTTLGPWWHLPGGTDIRLGVPGTLQSAYTNGGAGVQSIQLASDAVTNRSIRIMDGSPNAQTNEIFSVVNGGNSLSYLQVIGTPWSSYPGLRVYQHINAWNSNVLYIGDDPAQTTGIMLGSAGITTTVPGTLSVTGTLTANSIDRANAGTINIGTSHATAMSLGSQAATTNMNIEASSYLLFHVPSFYVATPSAATAGTTMVNSSNLILRGAYWNGTASTNVDNFFETVIDSTTPTSHIGASAFLQYIGATTGVPPSPWIAPTLLNSWVAFDAAHSQPGYFKDANGIVHLRGNVKNGATSTSVVWNLPAGYRPLLAATLPTTLNAGASGQLQISANGDVLPTVGNTTEMSLDGISFLAEQ